MACAPTDGVVLFSSTRGPKEGRALSHREGPTPMRSMYSRL